MDRETLRNLFLDIIEQEVDKRPDPAHDAVKVQEGLNLDSVDMLSVIMRVETKLQIQLDSKDLQSIVTVGDLLDMIQGKITAKNLAKAA